MTPKFIGHHTPYTERADLQTLVAQVEVANDAAVRNDVLEYLIE